MPNYAERDKEATIALYIPLWIRKDIDLETFDSYWGNVHGPVCSRQPALYQYWQIRTSPNGGGIWHDIEGVRMTSEPGENFEGIAELTFKSQEDIPVYIKAGLEYLGEDDPNFLRRAIAYVSTPITYYDEIEDPTPTLEVEYDKFHIMIRKRDDVSLEDFEQWLQSTFAPKLAKSAPVVKLKIHLFRDVDKSRQDSRGVAYSEEAGLDIQSVMEIGFKSRLALQTYLASDEYKAVTADMAKYVKSFQPYPERSRSTCVYNGEATLVGQRGLAGALAIEAVGAVNQIREDFKELMLGKR